MKTRPKTPKMVNTRYGKTTARGAKHITNKMARADIAAKRTVAQNKVNTINRAIATTNATINAVTTAITGADVAKAGFRAQTDQEMYRNMYAATAGQAADSTAVNGEVTNKQVRTGYSSQLGV